MKAWTVLVYLAGDNGRFLSSLEGEGFADLAEMKQAGSGAAVDVVAQFDRMTDACSRRYHLTTDGDLASNLVQDLGETNSGDAQVLLDFITWAVRSYPAERYLLVLWNHGSGWKDDDVYAPYRSLARRAALPTAAPEIAGRRVSRALFRSTLHAVLEEETNQVLLAQAALRRGGESPRSLAVLPPGWTRPATDRARRQRSDLPSERAVVTAMRAARPPQARAICFDDSSKDFLDSRDLKAVLDATVSLIGRKVDVLGMDACLMSMIEMAYQTRNGARVMVSSEDAEPGSGWPYRSILTLLAQDPAMTAEDLGKAVVDCYVRSYDESALSFEPVTQSALNLGRAEGVVSALDELARGLIKGSKSKGLRAALAEARYQAQSFMDPDYVDLFDFVSLLAANSGARPVRDACERLLAAIAPGKPGSLVIANGQAGLAERNANGLSIYFPKLGVSPFYAALDMSRDCAWARLLEVMSTEQ
jgi:hypothetical protein